MLLGKQNPGYEEKQRGVRKKGLKYCKPNQNP
jgi:hypothetical protein